MTVLTVLFDIKNPLSFLALQPTVEMLDRLQLEADWQPLLVASQKRVEQPAESADRGELHRWHRAEYRLADLRRYGQARGLPADWISEERLFNCGEGRAAAAACLWCRQHEPDLSLALLSSLFQRFWQGQLDLNSLEQMQQVLIAVTGRHLGLVEQAADALVLLEAQQLSLRDAGCFDVPGYLVAGKTYYGRQHLPMVEWHLQGEPGNPPAWGRYEQ